MKTSRSVMKRDAARPRGDAALRRRLATLRAHDVGPTIGLPDTTNALRTESFELWFAASKVVDAIGKPLVVYHGTTVAFTEFGKTADGGYHFGDRAAAGWRLADLTGDEATPGNRVISVYLSIQHPKILNFDAGDAESWRAQIEEAKAQGYDGIRYLNDEELEEDFETGERLPTCSWIAFEPQQIRILANTPAHMA